MYVSPQLMALDIEAGLCVGRYLSSLFKRKSIKSAVKYETFQLVVPGSLIQRGTQSCHETSSNHESHALGDLEFTVAIKFTLLSSIA